MQFVSFALYASKLFANPRMNLKRQRTRVAFYLRGDRAINASRDQLYPPVRGLKPTHLCIATISGPLPEHQSIHIYCICCTLSQYMCNKHITFEYTQPKPWAHLGSRVARVSTGYVCSIRHSGVSSQ